MPVDLEVEILGNTAAAWGVAAGVVLLAIAILSIALRVVSRHLRAWAARTQGTLDDAIVAGLEATRPWFIFAIALFIGTQALSLTDRGSVVLGRVVALVLILQAGYWGNAFLKQWLASYLDERRSVDATGATTAAILGFLCRVLLWSLIVLLLLDNLGIDVTALVASLGIGGIAVALALQNILGDIFASLALALDKPVVIGDFIVVGDVMGTVEAIGLKTTRLRSLSGELVVLPNSDLLSSRIRNYKRMVERRVLFSFGVTYETPIGKLNAIPILMRQIIDREELARFDRAHLGSLGPSGLDFEVVYFVNDPDYNKYMDVQQRINLALLCGLREAGVEFAYPTQTIHLATPAGACP